MDVIITSSEDENWNPEWDKFYKVDKTITINHKSNQPITLEDLKTLHNLLP